MKMHNNKNTRSIDVPTGILKDLRLRAQENGRTLEAEVALRLTLSLERDLAMIQEDNECALRAFEVARRLQTAAKIKRQ